MAKWIVLALVALTALKDAATDSPRKCSAGCKNAPAHDFKFNLQPGHTYVYNFEATTETSVPGAAVTGEDEKAGGQKAPGGQRLHITGQAELHAGSDCNHVMQLLHVQVTGADGKKFQDFASCEKHPLGFSWNNGRLGDELCVEDGDTPVNVNVKRAILSLIQVSNVQPSGSVTLHETDIFGTCPTEFTFHEDAGVLKVSKRRNLNRCGHREGLHQTFFTAHYDGPSDFQSSPLLQSNLQVEQTIKDKVVISAVGHENYLFRPFSNGASGALTTVTTRLTLVKHQPGPAPAVTNGHSSSILFDSHKWNYGGGNPEDQATAEHVIYALKSAEKSLSGGASSESAGLFRHLTRVMRYANAESLMAAYSQAKAGTGFTSKKLAKAAFLDALLQTGTGQSIEAVVQLINAKDLSPEVSKLYYLGFSFIRHATRGSLKAVASLLESPSLPPEAYLGAGALVGRYCSEHQCDDTVPEFKVLVGKLAHKLGEGCKPLNRVHENEIVGALKGLQNAKKMTAEAADAVMKCAVNVDAPTRVRVAALDAFLGDPCHQKLKKTALEMMKNRELDSELRIKAYLAVTECPCETVANAVKEMMDDEPVYQVGSFVSSHLVSLRTSSNPDKAGAKHYLAGIRPKKRYPFDPTKFSRAYETSYSMDGLNMATSAEGNVIFSQKSFVPRSASLNLTTSLFGHSFNLFEVGVRAENVDFLLESLFGPRGYFDMHEPEEVVEEAVEELKEVIEHFQDRVKKTKGKRVARHVTREMVDAVGKKVGHSVDHDDHSLDIDVHMKLFGSEVGWANYHGAFPKMSAKSGVDKFFDHVDDGINKAKDFKLDFSPNVALLDSQLVYPTGAGFSLILDASAYSSVDLKVESQLDIPAILNNPGNSKFHLKLLPSASVEVTGAMFVDAFSNVMAGLEVVGTVHSSTGFGLDVQALQDGHGVEVKLGVPKAKQEVFSFSSQVLSIRREKGHASVHAPVKFNKDSKSYHGCFEQLTPLTGLVFCGDVKFPWDGLSSAVLPKSNQALFPLDGPVKASFHIEKENEALTHYYFRALFSDKGPHKKHFEMKLDTPNSKVDRAVQLSVEAVTEPDKVLSVNVKTPWIRFAMEGAAISNQKEHSLMGKYASEGNEYMAKIGLVVKSESGNKKEYTPTLEVSYPEKKKIPGKGPRKQKPGGAKGINIEGTITIERDDAVHKHVYTFNGVNVITPKGKYGLGGSMGRDDKHTYSTDITLKYDELRQYFALKSKVNAKYEGLNAHGLKLDAEFTSSQFPDVGFHLKLDSQVKMDHIENSFDLIHGPDLKSEVAHLHFSNIYVYKHESKENFEVSVNNRVKYPLVGLEGKLEAEVSQNHVQYDFDVKYDKHRVDSSLDFKFGKSLEEGYDFKWGVLVLGTGFELDSKRVFTSPKNSKVDVCLELKPGGRKYELESELTHSYIGAKQFDFRANTVLKMPGHEHYRLDGGAAVNANEYKTHLEAHVGKVCHVNLRAHGEIENDGQCKSAEWSALFLNHLQGSGHYSSDSKGKKGDFMIHLMKSDRKLKGDFSWVHPEDGTCKTLFDFFWDADKDPSKKLHFESVNHLQPKSLDSKNKLVMMGETTRVDAKISVEGDTLVGTQVFSVDVYLPSSRHISINCDSKFNLRPSSAGDSDSDVNLSVCDKHSAGESCFKLREILSNFNYEKGSYACSHDGSFVRYDGKDLKFGSELKILPKDEKKEFILKGHVGGSLLGPTMKPLSLDVGGEVMNGDYSYHALGKVGEDQSLAVNGKLDSTLDGGKTKAGEFHVEAHTDIEHLKHITFGQVAKVTQASADDFEYSSATDMKWDGDKKLTLRAKVHKESSHKGSASYTICLPGDTEDHGVVVEWNNDAVNPKVEGAIAFMWPQGKKMKFEVQAEAPKDALAVHLTAHTPVQGHEKMEIIFNHKNLKAEHVMETDVTLVASPDYKTTVHSHVEYPQNKRVVDLSIARQGGPTNKLHARVEKKGENHFESELKTDWEGQSLTAESSLRFSGIEDFAIHGFLDSTALKVNKWSIDIASKEGGAKGSKGGKGGKKIVFTGKKADDVVFQGSTSFSHKQEGNTLTYEGAGQLKMGDETRNANFKLFTKTLSAEEGGENGIETKMTLGLTSNKGDKHNVVGEARLTSKEVRFYNSYCKGGSECSFVEAYSKVKFEDLQHDMDHEFAFILDLEKLFHVVPVSIKGNTHRSEHGLDHKVEAEVNKGKSKYSYHLYTKSDEAGAVLVFPKRTLAAVATFAAKPNGEFSESRAEVSVWLDKERHPELKTSVALVYLLKLSVPQMTLKTEAKLSHPSLGRDLAVRGELHGSTSSVEFDSKLEFDVFAKKEQMVVVTAKVDREVFDKGGNLTALVDFKSKGQNIDAEWLTYGYYAEQSVGLGSFITYLNSKNERKNTGALFKAHPKSVFVLVKVDSHEVLKADVKIDISEAKQVVVSEVGVLGKHTHVDTYEFHGLNSFKYSSHEKGSPNDQIQAHGTLVWGKAFEVHVDRLKGGQKEVLANLFVNLDQEHFFDAKHTWEQEHVKQYVSDVMNDYKYMTEEARKMTEEMCESAQADGKHYLELLKKALPNIKPLIESYKKQMTEMKDEILSDEYVQHVVVAVEKAVHTLKEAFQQTIEKLEHLNEEFEKVWNQYWEKVIAFYEKMVPMVRESLEKVTAAVCDGFEKFSHYVVEVLEKLFNFMHQFSGEFKAVGKVIVQFIQDVARTIGKLVDEAKHRFEEWKQVAAEHLNAIPAFEMVKEYYDGFMANLPETVDSILTEVMATLKESAPTEELKEFLGTLETYLKKKLNHEAADDEAELKNLYHLLVKAVKSLEDLARAQGHDYPKDFSLSQLKFPLWSLESVQQSTFSFDDIARLPFFFAVRASPFFYKVDDFPTPAELFSEYMPTLLRGQLPPQDAHGYLVGGEHFFTFDNRHYTLSGCACDYVLAQDFEDGNFSIVGHYEGGKLLSITLVDPKDMFELSMDLTLKVNGQPSEFPVRHETMAAWSEFDTVSMKTKYGAKVTCDRRFKDVCLVTVDGYYFGKTRGLLGTLNNEPYDDFVMPSGKVAPSVDKLANAWKTDSSCGDVAAQTHVHGHVKQCSAMFAGFSPMRICFPVVNPASFREACDADVAMRNGDPCKFAAAYAAACYYNGIKVRVPDLCGQCKVGGSPVDQGSSVSLKAPQGKADIILAVEQVPQNEALFKELLIPLLTSLTNDLKAHKITDVKFVLIGYGEHNNPWPNVYTTNGQVGFDGKGENVHFPAPKPGEDKLVPDNSPQDVVKFAQMIDRLDKLFDVEFAQLPYADAFYLARQYPFRPGAAKAVISLMHSRCLYSPLPISTQSVRLFIQKKQYEMAGVAFHVLSPMTFTSATRDKKQIRQIVGLDKGGVFSLGDAKKKVLDGDAEFRKDVSYDTDVCVDFAQATNGAAYSTRNFAELPKPGFKKQFTNVVSSRVVQSLSYEFTEDCTCQLYHGWHPVTRCKVTSRKESARLTTKSVKG